MKRWKKALLLISPILISSSSVAANSHYPWNFFNQRCCARPLITVSGGVIFTSDAGKSTTFPVIDSSTYAYSADHDWNTRGIFGLFVGEEIQLDPLWGLQLGLAYYQAPLVARGQVTQGADAQSLDTFNYHYDIVAQQALIESKLLLNQGCFHPYVSAGIGASFNESTSYHVNNPPFLTFSPVFGRHTETSFTYVVGVGVDVDVPQNWRFGLGYRFRDFGRSKLGSGHIDTVPISNTLSQSHLYTHELLAQLSYFL